jgi:hypothetical protein
MNPETTTELVTIDAPKDLQERAADKVISPFTVETLVERVELVKEAMRRCMEKDLHYGQIPGCGKKPVLLKPGAEMLGTLFNLGQRYRMVERLLPGDHVVYTVTCTQFYRPTGADIADGLGACSSLEYKWRIQTEPRTLDNGKVIAPKYTAHDFLNNALKIAAKRALVASIINATGVSSLFNQDLEDNPDQYREQDQPSAGKPQSNGNGHAAPEPVTLKGVVSGYEAKPSAGKLFHGALVGEARVVTTELGHTLKQLGGLEVAVLAVPSKKPGVYHLRSIQSVMSPNGAAKRPADKPVDAPAERTPWEEVQRQLVESDMHEHFVLKAVKRLGWAPPETRILADLGPKGLGVLLVRWSDLLAAARSEEAGIQEEAAA